MLLTGNRVAESFSNNGYPCLYRVHQKNQTNTQGIKERLDILIKKCKKNQYQKLYQLVDGLYPKGWYSMSGSHEGLGLDHYCHCTSNLRRSADVVMEHALEVCQDKKPTDQELVLLEKEIQTQANMINAKEEPIDWFVKEYKRNYARKR